MTPPWCFHLHWPAFNAPLSPFPPSRAQGHHRQTHPVLRLRCRGKASSGLMSHRHRDSIFTSPGIWERKWSNYTNSFAHQRENWYQCEIPVYKV
jgi:hypothetical protein